MGKDKAKHKGETLPPETAQLDQGEPLTPSDLAKFARQRRAQEQARQRRERTILAQIKARHRKEPKRELSQLRFASQHWWRDKDRASLTRGGLSEDEAKASLIYEAMRRRPAVQQAWFEGKFLFGSNGWQVFTDFVVNYLPHSWPELDSITRQSIIEASYSPWSVPPEGYSTFPADKTEQRKVSMQVLRLPEPNDAPDAAQRFVEHARRFEAAGYLIVAVDKKQNQAVRAAFEAIEKLPPTFRAADLKEVMLHHSPPNISDADKQALAEKERQGTLTHQDFAEIWKKCIKPTSSLFAPWHTTAEVEERVFHKRKRQEKLIEEKPFNFESICRQLETHDSGQSSDFVNRLRL